MSYHKKPDQRAAASFLARTLHLRSLNPFKIFNKRRARYATASFFTRLPPELRERIYKFVAIEAVITFHPEHVEYSNASLMRTCRTAAKEAQWIFYREANLRICNDTLIRLMKSPTTCIPKLFGDPYIKFELDDWLISDVLCISCETPYLQLALSVISQMKALSVDKTEYARGLCASVYHEKPELVGAILDAGADIDYRPYYMDMVGRQPHGEFTEAGNPLDVACRFGLCDMAQLLLTRGANMYVSGHMLMTALPTACYYGKKDVAELLLSHGADINHVSDDGSNGTSALAESIRGGHDKIFDMLLARGAQFVHTQRSNDIIATACEGGSIHILETLVQRGASLGNHRASEYLSIAAHNNRFEAVDWLLQQQLFQVDADGWSGPGSALKLACDEGHLDVASLLVAAGADINIDSTLSNADVSALQRAAQGGHAEIVQMLVQNGANINATGRRGTALTHAAYGGHEDIVKYLMAKGADVNSSGGYWGPPLGAALLPHRQNHAMIEYLLDEGASVPADYPPQSLQGTVQNLRERLTQRGVRISQEYYAEFPVEPPVRLPRPFFA